MLGGCIAAPLAIGPGSSSFFPKSWLAFWEPYNKVPPKGRQFDWSGSFFLFPKRLASLLGTPGTRRPPGAAV